MQNLIELTAGNWLGTPVWAWLVFAGIVVVLLVLDLGLLHKSERPIQPAESLLLSTGYISVALAFGAGVWMQFGAQAGLDYYTAFLVEKSLSMDNVFVIALVFSALAIFLMVADTRFKIVQPIRAVLGTLLFPVQWLAMQPVVMIAKAGVRHHGRASAMCASSAASDTCAPTSVPRHVATLEMAT